MKQKLFVMWAFSRSLDWVIRLQILNRFSRSFCKFCSFRKNAKSQVQEVVGWQQQQGGSALSFQRLTITADLGLWEVCISELKT